MDLSLLLEAERRGILPPEKASILAEARNRGLVPPADGDRAQRANDRAKWLEQRNLERMRAEIPQGVDLNNLPSVTDTGGPSLDVAPVGQGEAALRSGVQGLTFGGGDEGSAAVRGVMTAAGFGPNVSVLDETAKDRYQAGYNAKLDEERARLEEGRENHGTTSFLAELGGAIVSPASLLAAPRIVKAASGLGKIGRGATSGATAGGVYGFLSGEDGGEERLSSAAIPAAVGGVVGAAIPAAGSALRTLMRARAQNKATSAFVDGASSVDDLKAEAGNLYRGGASAPKDAMTGVFDAASVRLRKLGAMHPDGSIPLEFDKLGSALDTLTKYGDEAMTPEQMMTVRRQIAKIANGGGTQGKAGRILLEEFDKVTEPLHPGIKAGNEVFTRAKKLETLNLADELAEDAASANYTRASYDTAIRQRARELLKKIKSGSETRFNADEIAQLQRVANGGNIENAARWMSRSAPSSLGSLMFQGGVPAAVGSAFGTPGLGMAVGAGAVGAGALAKLLANRVQAGNVGVLKAMTATGKRPPLIPQRTPRGILEHLSLTGAVPTVQ